MTAPSVLIVDDHQLLAQSLAVALEMRGLHTVVPTLGTADELARVAEQLRPDLVLLDLELGGDLGNGEDHVRWLTDLGARVLVVSSAEDRTRFAAAVEAGAVGFLGKEAPFAELLSRVLAAAAGEEVLAERDRMRLLDELRVERARRDASLAPFERLTAREADVLADLAAGRAVAAIAEDRVVAPSTVRSQVRGILDKLGVSSQLEAVALARQVGWLDA